MNTQLEPSRPSRSLADWMILAGMFIFLVILSHGQMTTANELKKLNERMDPTQLGVYPPTVPPPPTAVQPKYEYLVELFQGSCYRLGASWPPPHDCNITSIRREYADFLTNKSAEGWELFQDTTLSNNIEYGDCIFRRSFKGHSRESSL